MSLSRLSFLALACSFVALSSTAHASPISTFTSGGYYSGYDNNFSSGLISFTYNGVAQTGAAGNIAGSTGVIGGQAFTFSQVFCVDLNDDIYLNTTYNATYTSNGVVGGAAVNNAGMIAWLLLNEAPLNTTVDGNEALQAAIWKTEYGSNFSLSGTNDAAMIQQYNADLAAVSGIPPAVLAADIRQVEWMTPTNGNGTGAQDQVALAVTPEPSGLALLGTGFLAVAGAVRRRIHKR